MRIPLLCLCFLLYHVDAFAQSKWKYRGKFEGAYHHIISADRYSGNGYNISLINGLVRNDKFYIGIGLGISEYGILNIPDHTTAKAAPFFLNLEYRPLTGKFTPVLDFKIGHTPNQTYLSDVAMLLNSVELTAGVNYRLNVPLDIYLKGGVCTNVYGIYIPVILGVGF